MTRVALAGLLAASLAASHPTASARTSGTTAVDRVRAIPVSEVATIGVTVADMDRAVDFYTSVLDFTKVSDVEVEGREYELLTGVFGARSRVVKLKLGDEFLELTEFLAPKGRPFPTDLRPNDLAFQHVAVIVSDMTRAYARLRQHDVEHASSGPQRLPDWNPNAGGIRAFYFRDPDRHFLEILQFPPGKGHDKWQRSDRLFLGIDHTAIVVGETARSLRFYQDLLRMSVAGESENYDNEQEHLNNVFGARLRITALRAERGPGIEFLEYLAPRDGRPAPIDLRANDVGHWQTTLVTHAVENVIEALDSRLFSLVSPRAVAIAAGNGDIGRALLVRDPDGHGLRFATRADETFRDARNP